MGEDIKETQEELQEEVKEEKKPCCKKKLFAVVTLVVLVLGLIGTACYEGYHIKKLKAEKAKIVAQQQQQNGEQPGKKPSDYNVGKDYNSVIEGKKPVFVLFYADWCRYCIRFMPIYEQVAEKYKNDFEFAKVNVEDPKYENLVRENKIGGFPTTIIVDKKYDNRVIVPTSSLGSVDSLSIEIDRFVRIRKLLDGKH